MKFAAYFARFGWFIIRIVVIALLITGGLVLIFQAAMNGANAYVIVTDGMKMRAQTVLTPYEVDSSLSLSMYFTEDWLARDPVLLLDTYSSCDIDDFTWHFSMKSINCAPWNDTVTMTVEESIPSMTGTMETGFINDDGTAQTTTVLPAWTRGTYKITCVREGSSWRIDDVTLLEELEPEPTPTDEPKVTLPPETPEPSATPEPTESPEPVETLPPYPTIAP